MQNYSIISLSLPPSLYLDHGEQPMLVFPTEPKYSLAPSTRSGLKLDFSATFQNYPMKCKVYRTSSRCFTGRQFPPFRLITTKLQDISCDQAQSAQIVLPSTTA